MLVQQVIIKFHQFFGISRTGMIDRIWIEVDRVQIYVRLGDRALDNAMRPCLDLSYISIEPKGTGILTAILHELLCPNEAYSVVYVENVGAERFKEFLRRNDWNERVLSSRTSSFWKYTS